MYVIYIYIYIYKCIYIDIERERERYYPPQAGVRAGGPLGRRDGLREEALRGRRLNISSPPWINKRPPPLFVFSSKRPFSLFIYYQKGQKSTKLWPRPY